MCGFVGYDDTPRRGKRGAIIDVNDPRKFCKYMKELLCLSEYYHHEFVFINAWNEWGEGMHLEPDKRFEYAYLEAIQRAKAEYHDCLKLVMEKSKIYSSQIMLFENMQNTIFRYRGYWEILDKMLGMVEHNESIGMQS